MLWTIPKQQEHRHSSVMRVFAVLDTAALLEKKNNCNIWLYQKGANQLKWFMNIAFTLFPNTSAAFAPDKTIPHDRCFTNLRGEQWRRHLVA